MQSEPQLPVFENYLSLARKYCNSCETPLKGDQRQFLSHIQGLLLELYLHGRLLPDINSSAQDFENLFERNDKLVHGMIADKVPFSNYWQALEPFSIDGSKLGMGDLLDDLGDIYIDFKRAILLYDSNLDEAKQEAYWKLKFDFDFHLADHTMDALKAIHDYMGKDGYNGW
jgi:hypothetical protein